MEIEEGARETEGGNISDSHVLKASVRCLILFLK